MILKNILDRHNKGITILKNFPNQVFITKNLTLKNPVMVASGTFGFDGYGSGVLNRFNFSSLGGIVMKSTTLFPRLGNPTPRFYHSKHWTLNSIGIENPGIETVLREYAPKWKDSQVPIILSIAGESIDEYLQITRKIGVNDNVSALELNISCPNIENGMEIGQDPSMTKKLVEAMKKETSMPIIVKLSPNVTDIRPIALAAEEGGANALTLTNTLFGMKLNNDTGQSVLGTMGGGISGFALKPIALAMVWKSYQIVNIPIIGVGGISNINDALEYMHAGATAFQIGVANYANPKLPIDILKDLNHYCNKHRISDYQLITGISQNV